MLYHTHIPLESHIPLVANNIGVSRFWLYQTISPGLGVSTLGQALKPQFLSLATVERLTLGTKARTSIRRARNRWFLSNWDLEFPVMDLEPQETLEANLLAETENAAKSPDVAEPVLIERFTELSSEPLINPLTEKLDATEVPLLKPLLGSLLESPQQLLHPESAKLHNRKPNPAKQKARRKQKNPKKISDNRTKQLRTDSPQFAEQRDKQVNIDFLTQDEQWTRFQPERWSQAHLEKPDPLVGRNSIKINLPAELLQESLDSNFRKNPVEAYAQAFFNSVQTEADLTRQIQQEPEIENYLTEPKHRQKTSRQESNQQNVDKKQTQLPELAETLEAKDIASKILDLINVIQSGQSQSKKGEFTYSKLKEIDRRLVDNYSDTEKDNLQAEIIPNQDEQINQDLWSAKVESLEAFMQSPKKTELINQRIVDGALIDQLSKFKNDQILEDLVNVKTQEAETSVPIQGFSVGGQVKATTISAQEIDPSDTVPAMLTPGEFVVNATDAQKHLPLLQHLNQGGRLEEVAPIPSAKAAQMAEQNFEKYEAGTTASTHLQLSARLGAYQFLGNSESKPLQSGIFAEPHLDQLTGYGSPEFIFRFKQSSSPHPSSSPEKLPIDSTNQWSSVEELLQITDTNSSDFSSTCQLNNQMSSQLSDQPTKNSQISAIPISSGLQIGESIASLSHRLDLQPMGISEQAIANNPRSANETKNLELVMETLSQEIYSRLRQRLAIERERLGNFSGRLSW